jgi:hypothetical protein
LSISRTTNTRIQKTDGITCVWENPNTLTKQLHWPSSKPKPPRWRALYKVKMWPMGEAVGRLPLTKASYVGFVVDKAALGQVFLKVLQFSPVSIIPPFLHTHSFIYHTRCIMFLSQ